MQDRIAWLELARLLVMGITKVGTKEAEGFEEEFDSTEYHDATEEPSRKEETESNNPQQRSTGFQGGYGSSSLKECIELLNATPNYAPAPLDSGVGKKSTDPPQVLSPSMEGPLTDANVQSSNGSISPSAPQVKDEPQSQVKCDPSKETKPESSSSTREVKAEQGESENKEENPASVKQEERTPDPDSEDSFTPERVVEAVQ